MLGAWLSMTGISQGILTGASHGIGHQLGAFGVLHGYTSCIMAPHILKFNWDHLTEEMKESLLDAFQTNEHPYRLLYEYIKDLKMPQSLKDVEIPKDSIASIASKSLYDTFTVGNIKPMTSSIIQKMLETLYDKPETILVSD